MNLPDENNNITVARPSRIKLNRKAWKEIKSRCFVDTGAGPSSKGKKGKDVIAFTFYKPSPFALKLGDRFFKQPCITLAKDLLGKMLVRKLPSGEILRGMIVETESYLGVIDMASHSYLGKETERNRAMYMKPGTAYVYSIYGMYYCFNISSLEEGSAVLIRALQPVDNLDLMSEFRNEERKGTSKLHFLDICNGPAKLCQALKIDKDSFNAVDLCSSDELYVEEGVLVDFKNIVSCKRIGIDSCGEDWANKPFRFYLKGNRYVSHRSKSAERAHAEKLIADEKAEADEKLTAESTKNLNL